MKLNAKGQVTIPAQLRRELALGEGDEVEVVLRDGQLVILRSDSQQADSRPGRRLAAHMWKRLDTKLSTDEMMELLRGE
ncbi:AbrB/MazE/SpoVT family DNA-binding domain-containing protein [Pseudonocardia eucalypti]|uniref:AbrB/MazE/SpoVT family DNA-binding domain-containing protein n=1 Tax=Pseudonocardia eucalypti TaxID=648755 RepID=A0ABP9RD18_9PSEU|nr:AbrB family looped-hinge helix DNA binding protein [Pseudonocardia eucalypti]